MFDLASDPGESRNVIDDHPEVAQRLRQMMDDFEAQNVMPTPVNAQAGERDAAGWENLWYGIAAAVCVVLLALALVIKMLVMVFSRWVNRRSR